MEATFLVREGLVREEKHLDFFPRSLAWVDDCLIIPFTKIGKRVGKEKKMSSV